MPVTFGVYLCNACPVGVYLSIACHYRRIFYTSLGKRAHCLAPKAMMVQNNIKKEHTIG